MSEPIKIHPKNPKLFEYGGEPVMLCTPTEHYGAVMNRPFDYCRYLEDMRDKSINFTRLFLLFRELQAPTNPYSTCKPESPDYITPFPRTGPGIAADGEPKYDLTQWNPEFFCRLHEFLSIAEEYGVIVEVVLFSNTYSPQVWALNPMYHYNNFSDLDEIVPSWYTTLRDKKRLAIQEGYVDKVIHETNKYSNIVYEICNEPGGDTKEGPEPYVTTDDTNAWLSHMIARIRSLEKNMPNKHLIFGQEAFTWADITVYTDKTFDEMDYDVANIHPIDKTKINGRVHDLGVFMAGWLRLQNYRDFCLEAYARCKPYNMDEDNTASCYKSERGWIVHRKRAWTTLFCGGHYDYIDFSVLPYLEAGTPASNKGIRSYMSYIFRYLKNIDLVSAKPAAQLVTAAPCCTVPSVLGDGTACHVYLADATEYGEPAYGRTIAGGELTLALASGKYDVDFYDPRTGTFSLVCQLGLDDKTSIRLPDFVDDIVVRVRKV